MAAQLVLDARLDILPPVAEVRQREGPEIEPRQQILAEPSDGDVGGEIAIGAGDELEVAFHLLVGADRQEALFLDRAEDHRLLVRAHPSPSPAVAGEGGEGVAHASSSVVQ